MGRSNGSANTWLAFSPAVAGMLIARLVLERCANGNFLVDSWLLTANALEEEENRSAAMELARMNGKRELRSLQNLAFY